MNGRGFGNRGGFDPRDEEEERVPCQWFALCENEATTTRRGPVGDGAFGPVPICARCDEKIARLEADA